MRTVHVVPVGDVVHHDFPGAVPELAFAEPPVWITVEGGPGDSYVPRCACGPVVEAVSSEVGPSRWRVTHYALDGRELHEDAP